MRRVSVGSSRGFCNNCPASTRPALAESTEPLARPSFTLSPKARTAATSTLGGRAAWATQLLDKIADGTVARDLLDAPLRLQLTRLADAAVQKRLTAVFGRSVEVSAATKEDIAAAKARWNDAVLAKADLQNGRSVYARTCMACHKLFGQGTEFGDRLLEKKRLAEVAGEHATDPHQELRKDRLVKAQFRADDVHVLRRRRRAREDRRRIARRQSQQQEHQHGNDAQDGDRRKNAPGDEGDQFFLMFQ